VSAPGSTAVEARLSADARLYTACIAILAVCLAGLAWKVTALRSAAGPRGYGSDQAAVGALLQAPLSTADGRTVRLADLPQKHLLLFIFSPSDCPACLDELVEVARVATERPNLAVFALMAHASVEEAVQTRASFGFGPQILLDRRASVVRSLSLPRTPWKLVIDRETRQVLFEDPPSMTPVERQAFLERMLRMERPGAGPAGLER
jgi:peroxiredoxin